MDSSGYASNCHERMSSSRVSNTMAEIRQFSPPSLALWFRETASPAGWLLIVDLAGRPSGEEAARQGLSQRGIVERTGYTREWVRRITRAVGVDLTGCGARVLRSVVVGGGGVSGRRTCGGPDELAP